MVSLFDGSRSDDMSDDKIKKSVCLFVNMAGIPLRGYAVMKLWAWFLIPIGLPEIHLLQAIGIGAFVSLVVPFLVNGKELDGDETIKQTAGSLTKSVFFLAFGWFIKSLMVG